MPTLTQRVELRLPPELAEQIKQLAWEHHRSMNKEIVEALSLYAKSCRLYSPVEIDHA